MNKISMYIYMIFSSLNLDLNDSKLKLWYKIYFNPIFIFLYRNNKKIKKQNHVIEYFNLFWSNLLYCF